MGRGGGRGCVGDCMRVIERKSLNMCDDVRACVFACVRACPSLSHT